MKIILTRNDVTDHGIFGHLNVEGSAFNCVTLERHDIGIPPGTYGIILYKSPAHGIVPLLENVPGRDFIEIHEGNYEHNSKGCILVGKARADIDGDGYDDITGSRDTLKQLVAILLHSPDKIYIEIS